MKFVELSLSGLVVVEADLFQDPRGFFFETYHKEKFSQAGINADFVQDNHSGSVKGTLRGLHYQLAHPQGKLVRVVSGEVFDVAVDVRRSSPTFGQWDGIFLSAKNKQQLWIPPGFAHGFYVISEWAEVLYKTSDIYFAEGERSILWNDPDIKIDWPIETGEFPILSSKDAGASLLHDAEVYQ
jgi:dTDP-4-dehydrorhamnose 3,5-epimerase